jgi:hypothetical protein
MPAQATPPKGRDRVDPRIDVHERSTVGDSNHAYTTPISSTTPRAIEVLLTVLLQEISGRVVYSQQLVTDQG